MAPEPPVAPAVIGAGSASDGAVVSWTVTSNVALPVLPAASVAEQVAVVVPSGNDVGVQGAASAPSTLSTALPWNELPAPAEDVQRPVAHPVPVAHRAAHLPERHGQVGQLAESRRRQLLRPGIEVAVAQAGSGMIQFHTLICALGRGHGPPAS